MSGLFYHTPLSGATRKHTFLAFDVEGVGGTGGFWCGAVFDERGGHTFDDRGRLWQYLTNSEHKSAWRVAHNLEYDLSVLNLEALLDGGAVMASSGLLWYNTTDTEGTPIRFVDSLNIFREQSVKSLGKLIGLPKLELPEGMLEAMRFGFPFEGWEPADQQLLIEYNLRDAEIIYRALVWLQEVVNDLGGQLRETIAGTSHDLYRRVYMPHAWPTVGPNTNEAARGAFYGGRVEPYRMGVSEDVNLYDVNSLYPSIMQEEKFPHPGSLDLDVPSRLPGDLDRREGVIDCTVRVPRLYTPPLPARVDTGLFFPTGEWRGAFCINELRHALSLGVEVTSINYMISTRRTFNPFEDFVADLWEKRSQYLETNPVAAQVVKMLLNAHIGRYGIKTDPPLCTLEIVKQRFDPEKDQGLIWDHSGPYDYVERPLPDKDQPTYANVFFAAQVAAGARVKLHQAMLRQDSNLVYCDTDSIMTHGKIETGKGLGEWKCLLESGEVDLIGPKEYMVLFQHQIAILHAKGVPRKVAEEYLKNGYARFQRAVSLRQSRHGRVWPGAWVETYQQRGNPTPKRDPMPVKRGWSGPVKTGSWKYLDLSLEVQSARWVQPWKD